jgi:hypothetical protein
VETESQTPVAEGLMLNAQAFSALGSSALDHKAAGLCPHSFTEAVLSFPTKITWLKGSFHSWFSRKMNIILTYLVFLQYVVKKKCSF